MLRFMDGAERRFYGLALAAALLSTSNAGAETGVERIRTHLERVENQLRETSTPSLTPEQLAARAENLDRLHEYWTSGVFPVNLDFPEARTPYFIDAYGTACAVAHLVVESGHRELAERLAAAANNAYLPDIQDGELDEWISSSGLTPAEHALIQPTYDFYCTDGVKSGDETDVDCGGTYCDPCPQGAGCVMSSDCLNANCVEGICDPGETAAASGSGGSGNSGGSSSAGGAAGSDASGGAESDGDTSAATTTGDATATDGFAGTGGDGSDTADSAGPTTGSEMATGMGGTVSSSANAADSTSGGDDEPEGESKSGDDAGCSCTTIGGRAPPWRALGLSLLVIFGIVRRR